MLFRSHVAALLCGHLLHACEGGGIGNANNLELAVLHVFSQAGTLQATSVALPLMGAGRARWPIETAAKLQIAAALQYIHHCSATSLKVSAHSCTGVCLPVGHDVVLPCHVAQGNRHGATMAPGFALEIGNAERMPLHE